MAVGGAKTCQCGEEFGEAAMDGGEDGGGGGHHMFDRRFPPADAAGFGGFRWDSLDLRYH